MHLVAERKVIYWVLVLTATFVVAMVGLIMFSHDDQQGRQQGIFAVPAGHVQVHHGETPAETHQGVTMSLKAFHVFFITISVLLCLGFGAWCLNSDYAHGRTAYTIAGYVSFGLGVLLVLYEIVFLQEVQGIDKE